MKQKRIWFSARCVSRITFIGYVYTLILLIKHALTMQSIHICILYISNCNRQKVFAFIYEIKCLYSQEK